MTEEIDPEVQLRTDPLKLTSRQADRLKERFGEHTANEMIQRHTLGALGRVKLAPPYRGGRR